MCRTSTYFRISFLFIAALIQPKCSSAVTDGSWILFLQPSDISEADGVRLAVQRPLVGMELVDEKAEGEPSALNTPMATRVLQDGTTQVWYLRVDHDPADYKNKLVLCLGEIRDGKWRLPAVNSVSAPWGGTNNVVMTRSLDKSTWGGFNPFQIVTNGNELEMLYWDQPGPAPLKAGAMRAVSDEGLTWRKLHDTVFTDFNDAFTMRKVGTQYWVYQTGLQPWANKPYADSLAAYKRVITLRTSSDHMASWTPQNLSEPTLAPDADDSIETEFYCLKTFSYGDGYAGILWKYYGDPKRPNKHSTIFRYEVVVSQDGVLWQRPYREMDIGFWSYADPIAIHGKTWFVTRVQQSKSGTSPMRLMGWDQDRMIAATGKGSFVTNALQLEGDRLELNADASKGEIRAEVLDAAGKPIAGFTRDEFEPLTADGPALQSSWRSNSNLGSLKGRTIRLKFYLKDSQLYGYRVTSRDRDSES